MPRPLRSSAATAVALAAALLSGCGATGGGSAANAPLDVYVSVPLTGAEAPLGKEIASGVRAQLAAAGGRAAGHRIRLTVLDDTRDGIWSPVATAANARRAAEDADTIAYIGDLDSGATGVSLPITNQAEIPQISPGSSAVDLTRAAPGVPEGDKLNQPSDRRTFVRIVPDDLVEGIGAARWAKRIGAKRAAIVRDQTAFAVSSANGFQAEAEREGILGSREDADAVYLAVQPAHAASRAATARRRWPRATVIGSRSLLDPAVFSKLAGGGGTIYAISPFAAAPQAYGREAIGLLLNALGRAADPADRLSVVESLFATDRADRRDSPIGPYAVEGTGDTTLTRLRVYRIGAAGPVSVAPVNAAVR